MEKEIIQDYLNGKPIKEIVSKWNIKEHQLYYILKKNYVTKKRIYYYSDAEIQKMIKLYNRGVKLKNIAQKFRTHRDSIYHILKRNQFKFARNKNRKIKEEDLDKIIKLYKNGLSTEKIAKLFGVTKSRIGFWLKRKNVKLKSAIECNKSRRKKIKLQIGLTKDKALLIGMLLSDGSESRKANNIILAGKEKLGNDFPLKLVEKIYGISGREDARGQRFVWHSENMRDDLHKYVSSIVHNPEDKILISKEFFANTNFSSAFLQGYFSCDGAVILNIDKKGNLNREVNLLSRNITLLKSISKMLHNHVIHHTVNGDFIHIATKDGLIDFSRKINLLPIKIAKGKYWRGATKDKLLETLIFSLQENFPKNLGSKQKGLKILHEIYSQLN